MSMTVVPHINFRGEARAALEFYKSVFNGELTIATYADLNMAQDPEEAKQVVWGQVAAASGFKVMAFDALPSRLPFERGQNSFYVAASFTTDEEIKRCWDALKENARIRTELGPAPWNQNLYGMLEDKFGVIWVMDVKAQGH